MTRKHPFSTVDRSLARRYLDAARRFKTDAENMMNAADGFSGNGIAVLCVSGKLVTFARWVERTFENLRQRAS